MNHTSLAAVVRIVLCCAMQADCGAATDGPSVPDAGHHAEYPY